MMQVRDSLRSLEVDVNYGNLWGWIELYSGQLDLWCIEKKLNLLQGGV